MAVTTFTFVVIAFFLALMFRVYISLEASRWRATKAGELIGAAIVAAITKTPFKDTTVQPWYVKLDFWFKRYMF